MSMSTEPIRIRIFQPRDDTQNSSTTPPNSFIELKESSINSESFLQKLRLFLKDGELKNLRDPAAAEVADFLGELITGEVLNAKLSDRGNTIRALCSLCSSWGVLPASCVFKGEVKVTEEFSHIVYGTAPEVTRELWKGTWVETNEKVAIKVIGIGQDVAFYPEKSKERLCEEMISCKYLNHENLLPVYGVCLGIELKSPEHTWPCLVSLWMKNGNILDFVRNNPECNRFKLLFDVCKGLMYLHSQGFVHGGLNRNNVLVDDKGRARLADSCFTGVLGFTDAHLGTEEDFEKGLLYMAPELVQDLLKNRDLIDEYSPPLKKSVDVYAFGVLVFELIFEKHPFDLSSGINHPEDLRLPSWFPNLGNNFWNEVEHCCSPKPEDRPHELDEICRILEGVAR